MSSHFVLTFFKNDCFFIVNNWPTNVEFGHFSFLASTFELATFATRFVVVRRAESRQKRVHQLFIDTVESESFLRIPTNMADESKMSRFTNFFTKASSF